MSQRKRVAIIGAGPSGLTAIKCCKEENIEPVCFERNGEPGGLWRYHDEDIDGVASVMKTTIINTSKETSAFSDFPPPKGYPNFMHNSMMFNYFMLYAEHFDLLKHIRYYLEVVDVEPTNDHEETGRWTVSVRSSQTEAITKEVFDGIMVCIGHHVFPNIPKFPGQEKFRGPILHSHSIKSCDRFKDQRVVVVGIGNSGVDAAVDCTFVAKNVYISTRRGSWIFSRVGPKGEPYDMLFNSRKITFLKSLLPYETACKQLEEELNKKFDHELYKLKPKHRVMSAHPTMNDALPNCILSGRIVIKGDVKQFEENGVLFEGEDEITEADVVILATGYQIKFPFIEKLLTFEDNAVSLYKYAIPPHMKHHNIAIIGLIQPLGPIFPIAEMQCRWFTQILKGKLKLPSIKDMEKDIQVKNEANAKRYTKSLRHTIQVDFIPFLDEIASEIGAKPNLIKMAFTDPKLFFACFNGPCLPYQFRLQGPHPWQGAREAILTLKDRVYAPLNDKIKSVQSKQRKFKKTHLVILLILGSTGVYYAQRYFKDGSYSPILGFEALKAMFTYY